MEPAEGEARDARNKTVPALMRRDGLRMLRNQPGAGTSIKDYASVSTLVTLGSTEMPGPNVVATVAFWM